VAQLATGIFMALLGLSGAEWSTGTVRMSRVEWLTVRMSGVGWLTISLLGKGVVITIS